MQRGLSGLLTASPLAQRWGKSDIDLYECS